MADEIARASRYKLSFTSGALLMREAVIAAPLYLRVRDWSKVRAVIEGDNLLQARTVASGQRFAREVERGGPGGSRPAGHPDDPCRQQ